MADNTILNVGSGGDTIATKDVAGVKHELVVAEFSDGAGGVTEVSASTPFPVTDAIAEAALASIAAEDFATETTLAALLAKITNPLPVSGTVSVDTSLLSTSAKQDVGNTSLASIDSKLTNPLPVSGTVTTGGLTDTQLRATPVPVSNASLPLPTGASISALQTTGNTSLASIDGKLTNPLPVSGTVVTGGLTDTQLRATAVPVSGTFFQATQPVSGTFFQATQPVSASSLPLPSLAATSTKQSDGTQKSQVVDGSGNVIGATSNALDINIKSGNPTTIAVTQATASNLKAQIASTQKPSYGATVVLAVTALQSLASSATAGWKSVRTSNLSTLATDYEVFISLSTAATTPANDKCVYLFVIPWYTSDAGAATWFASSGGTATLPTSADATYTIASPHNFRLLGVLNYTTTSMVLQDTFLLSNCFGNRLPDGFSFCVINFSGAALGTGCILDITPLNDILV